MADSDTKVMAWGTIVAIMVATGVVVGVVLGLAGGMLGLLPNTTTAGVGASVGVVGAMLIARRRAALGQQNKG